MSLRGEIEHGATARFRTVGALVSVASLLCASSSLAHFGPKPTAPVRGVEGIFGDTHGGYGYIGNSETQAGAIFGFGCSAEERRQYVREACGGKDAPNTNFDQWVNNNIAPMTVQRLRDQVFEYLALQDLALQAWRDDPNETPRVRINRPACVSEASWGNNLHQTLAFPPGADMYANPKSYPNDQAIKEATNPRKSLLFKYRSVRAQLSSGNLMRAMTLHDQLRHHEGQQCALTTTEARARCADVRRKLERLRGAYPALFDWRGDDVPIANQNLVHFRNSMTTLLGQDTGASDPGAVGRTIYQDHITSSSIASQGELSNKLEAAMIRSSGLTAPGPMRNARSSLEAQIRVLRRDYQQSLQERANDVCNLSLDQLIQREPNVVRQALMDMGGPERSAAKAVLCASPSLASIRRAPNCEGVTGGPLPGSTPVRVDRTNFDFPFRTANNMSYTQPTASSPVTVNLTVYFEMGSDIPAAEAQAVRTRMQQEAQNFFSTQAAARTQPPPMRFNITVLPKSGDSRPVMRIHRCFNTDLGISDCNQLYERKVRDCIGWPKPEGGAWTEAECRKFHKGPGNPDHNRENANNLTTGTAGTVVSHEFAHLMGLDDEYVDPNYPFNELGEHDSVMRSSNDPKARMYPTHFDRLLEAVTCRRAP